MIAKFLFPEGNKELTNFAFYLVTAFIAFIDTFVMNIPFNVFDALSLKLFILLMNLFVIFWNTSLRRWWAYLFAMYWFLKYTAIGVNDMWMFNGILSNFVTTSSTSWFHFWGRDNCFFTQSFVMMTVKVKYCILGWKVRFYCEYCFMFWHVVI